VIVLILNAVKHKDKIKALVSGVKIEKLSLALSRLYQKQKHIYKHVYTRVVKALLNNFAQSDTFNFFIKQNCQCPEHRILKDQ
jgi:hypothetical protein